MKGTDVLHAKFCFRRHVSHKIWLRWKREHGWLASAIKPLAGMTWLGKILSEVFSALPAQSQLVRTNLITHLLLIKSQHP